MSKYLVRARYTQSGIAGLMKEGGSKRQQALAQTVTSCGGKLEGFYYALGDDDLILIVDLPEEANAVAMSMAINAAGALNVSLTKLIDVETIDAATALQVTYRAPGE